MYTSPDDARSDLMLAGAVFVFGPVVLSLLLTTIPLGRIPVLGVVLVIAIPVLLTAVVPMLMVRYRGENWSAYGFGTDIGAGLTTGFVLSLPIVAAGALTAVVSGLSVRAAIPLLAFGPSWLLAVTVRVATWGGLAILATYVTVKARDGLRADFRTVPEAMIEIGRIIAIVVAVAGLLRLVTTGGVSSVLLPIGIAGTAFMTYRRVQGPSSTSRAAMLTPTILLALGSFFISFSAARLVEGIWAGAMAAAIGLVIGALRERRISAWAVVGLTLAIALLTPMPLPLRLGL